MAKDVLSRTPPKGDYRLKYGNGDLQFGELFLPRLAAGKRAPVLMFVHGGWWKNEYGLEYGGHLCDAFRSEGIAAWSTEYRRVGDAGGGFPGTCEDVAAGFDYLKKLAESYPLDLNHVAVAGHSAGGHLAFWLAGRPNVPEQSSLHKPPPALAMHGVVSLAGAIDLRATIELAGHAIFAHDKLEVERFMGGSPKGVPERYRAGDPGELMPITTPQWLLQGTKDDQIPPELPGRWAERGRRLGEQVTVEMIPGADHFDVVDPLSKAWPKVRAAVRAALGIA